MYVYKAVFPDNASVGFEMYENLKLGQSLYVCMGTLFRIKRCPGCTCAKDMKEYIIAEMNSDTLWLEEK